MIFFCENETVPRPRKSETVRLEAELRRRIDAREWRPGARLPSVTELSGLHGVSRESVSRIYARLQADGLVEIRPMSGVFMC